ncbi:MAG TPA: cellulase family glycosylhydrolase [Mycobacteriales bacterium]|nr:cellulase family glycosylhydrolase [Mycobacteriales bacterium]
MGSWLVDAEGRVVVTHGFNVVKKLAPYYPSTFTAADAKLLANEGFTSVRTGFMWEAAEPSPGRYDDRYIGRVVRFTRLLARYGIRTLLDVHQDLWGRHARLPTPGDGAPGWATLGLTFDDSFTAFWQNRPAADGVGIQTRYVQLWRHIAGAIRHDPWIIGIDPFNEPYVGTAYACDPLFAPCPAFETTALPAFYNRVIHAVRAAGARQVIFPETIAYNGSAVPTLPGFADRQTAYSFHFYCSTTQNSSTAEPYGSDSSEARQCKPTEDTAFTHYRTYLHRLHVPGFLGEFSCNDIEPDNAQVVDLADKMFTSWTAWMYYTAADDPANCAKQGLLKNDARPASERNAKQAKLDVFAEPYAQYIAGTPISVSQNRTTHRYVLRLRHHAVPGVRLRRGALTQIFIPARDYPHGYRAIVRGGRTVSAAGSPWLLVKADAEARNVSVTVVSDAHGQPTKRPTQTGWLPLH